MEDKEKIYTDSKIGFPIGYGKRPAVIVVDLQKGFTSPDSFAGCDMTEAVEQTNRIVDAAHEKNVTVFFARIGYQSPKGVDLGAWGLKCHTERAFSNQSELYELDDRLHVGASDIIFEKHWASAFFGTHLLQMLINLQVDTTILTGCTTSGCLNASIIDAISHGFRTIVPREACWDRSVELHEMYLWNIGKKYADVVSTQDSVEYLNRIAPMHYANLW
ncbi:MAG: isochorismatase family protein [Oscillospiraceae bacterium]|jgi:nicotinamidase-related amidase|nr:isochorismatase family protein [Oscillospiraceae bacterium]